MIKPERFVVINGTSGIEEQQQLIRKEIVEIIPRNYPSAQMIKSEVLKDA
jgi:hypothetical protein